MMQAKELKEGERAIVVGIRGSRDFRQFLLTNGLSLGTVLTLNFSPAFTKLVNVSIGNRMLCIQKSDFVLLDLVRI